MLLSRTPSRQCRSLREVSGNAATSRCRGDLSRAQHNNEEKLLVFSISGPGSAQEVSPGIDGERAVDKLLRDAVIGDVEEACSTAYGVSKEAVFVRDARKQGLGQTAINQRIFS